MFHWFRKHTKDGLEKPDPTPLEITLTVERPLTLQEQMARFFRDPVAQNVIRKHGKETFQEADDFGPEWDDDEDLGHDEVTGIRRVRMHEDDEVGARIAEIEGKVVEPVSEERLEMARERIRRGPQHTMAKEKASEKPVE